MWLFRYIYQVGGHIYVSGGWSYIYIRWLVRLELVATMEFFFPSERDATRFVIVSRHHLLLIITSESVIFIVDIIIIVISAFTILLLCSSYMILVLSQSL